VDDELKKRFQIELSGAEALVLFEWLCSGSGSGWGVELRP
jgi:hypothetical protein